MAKSRLRLILLVVTGLVFLFGTTSPDCGKIKKKMKRKLDRMEHAELYMGMEDEPVHELWKEKNAECALKSIIADQGSKMRTRFLAAEIYLENADSVSTLDSAVLGEIYANALAENLTGDLNMWMRDTSGLGYTGLHLLRVGEPAVRPLSVLLDNNSPGYYSGSKSAELAERWGYRVKDVAAFFIMKIRNMPFTGWSQDRDERDILIARLKMQLSGK